MIQVVCVLKSGGIYDPSWVERLRNAVVQHMNTPHRFICLTDMELPGDIEVRSLHHGWPGWFSKMELFALSGPVLYLDLDVAIVGSLDALLEAPTESFDGRSFKPNGQLTAIRDFYRPTEYNSSVMLIEDRRDIYNAFVQDADSIMSEHRGVQEYLSANFPEAEVFMDGPVLSYRKHCRARLHAKGKPPQSVPAPAGASVVCFHGQPKMNEAEGWPMEYWAA